MPLRTFSKRCQLVRSLTHQRLEDRRFLAATIYVDFGFGTGDFTVSNTEVVALGGPEVFGESHTLESGLPLRDQNYDGVSDQRDLDALVAGIMNSLDDIFEPFDVEIEQANATNFSDVLA